MLPLEGDEDWAWAREQARTAPAWSDADWRRANAILGLDVTTRAARLGSADQESAAASPPLSRKTGFSRSRTGLPRPTAGDTNSATKVSST